MFPACMMPDGAEPCESYTKLREGVERIGRLSHSGTGTRTFDDLIRDVAWINDETRRLLQKY